MVQSNSEGQTVIDHRVVVVDNYRTWVLRQLTVWQPAVKKYISNAAYMSVRLTLIVWAVV